MPPAIKNIFGRVIGHPSANEKWITLAEKLGVPKAERNSIDNALGRAIGNQDEMALLRLMHFIENSPGNQMTYGGLHPKELKYLRDIPVTTWHRSEIPFNIFDYEKQSRYPDGHFFFTEDPNHQWGKGQIKRPFYIYDRQVSPISDYMDYTIGKNIPIYDLDKFSAQDALRQQSFPHTIYGFDTGTKIDNMYEFAIPFNNQMKLTYPLVYDDLGHLIKLSKRDNFSNPDIRYEQGGILKRIK